MTGTGKASPGRSEEFLRFVRNPSAVRRLLVLRSGMLGDTVFISPVLHRLRMTFPDSELHAAVSGATSAVLDNLPLTAVHVLGDRWSLAWEARFYIRLRKLKFDVALVLETNSHFTIMAKLAGARYLAGFENKLGSWLDYTVPWRPEIHFVRNELGPVLEWTRAAGGDPLRLAVTAGEIADAQGLLRNYRVPGGAPLVCIHPGTSVPDSVRQWVAERYAGVADWLVGEFGCAVAFTGTNADLPEIERIRSAMKRPSANLAGRTSIRQLMAVLAGARLVIGPDTGALHIATGVGTPVVMLMGYADPADTGPYDPDGRSVVARVDLPCSPCVGRVPPPAQWEACKVLRPTLCMSLLAEDAVRRAAGAILKAHTTPA